MSPKLLHNGALASLGCAATFVFGFVLLLTQLLPYIDLQHNPEEAVTFVLDNHAMLSVWNFVIYVLFGVLLAIVVIVLHWQFSANQSLLTRLGALMGLVWVVLVIASGMLANVGLMKVVELAEVRPDLAPPLWLSVVTVTQGLGGSNEIVGGLWVLLVSVAAWQRQLYSKALSIIGMVAGGSGVVSTVPVLSDLGALFGLLLIVWFIYLSRLMMVESANLADGENDGS